MKLRKVISGGQTGADQAGLEWARILGLETGGWMPANFWTEDGPAPDIAEYFGLKACPYTGTAGYQVRTHWNARDSDVTVWFGNIGSPGYYCTLNGCKRYKRPFHVNPDAAKMQWLANEYEVMNVAGNRLSKNPQVPKQVAEGFRALSQNA